MPIDGNTYTKFEMNPKTGSKNLDRWNDGQTGWFQYTTANIGSQNIDKWNDGQTGQGDSNIPLNHWVEVY